MYGLAGSPRIIGSESMKALQQIQDLKERYDREKRFYHSYGRFEYVIYRRMLMSPDAMTQAQLDSCFAVIQELANSNKIVKKDFDAPGSISKIRYYMATKRYKEAIPYLDLRLDQKDKYKPIWNECIKYRITAGKALGNDKDLDKYALQYIDCLERQQEQDLAAKARELQIAYDVSALEHQVSQLELEKKESQIRSSRIFIAASLTAFAVLLIMLMSVLRSKRELATMNDDLKEARSKAENANRMPSRLQKRIPMPRSAPDRPAAGKPAVRLNSRHRRQCIPPSSSPAASYWKPMPAAHCNPGLRAFPALPNKGRRQPGPHTPVSRRSHPHRRRHNILRPNPSNRPRRSRELQKVSPLSPSL